MTKFENGKSRFPTFAKAWDDLNSPHVRQLSRRLFWIVLPIFLIWAAFIVVSGAIYQSSH